jgi:hypothetical protein
LQTTRGDFREEIMRIATSRLITTSLVVFTALAAIEAKAATLEATSAAARCAAGQFA